MDKHVPKYFGDGEDSFSENDWEKALWALVSKKYAEKFSANKNEKNPFFHFFPPDYETIVEAENELMSMGMQKQYRK